MNPEQAEIHIRNIINNHTCVVDEGMLAFFAQEHAKNTYSSYENIQALALEYSLRQAGILETLAKVKGERYQWRHDWAYTPDILIDLKRRPAKYQNTTIGDPMKALHSYSMKQVTHYVIYTTNKERDLCLGDKLTFRFEDMIDVREALSKCIIKEKDNKSYALFPNRYRVFKDTNEI